MSRKEYIDEKILLKILDIGVSPYSNCTLYVCSTGASKRRFEKEYENILNKLVFTKREIYSDKALIGKLYKAYKFVK